MTQSMHLVLVSVQHGPQVTLMFNNEARAKAAYRVLRAEGRGEDDFEFEVSDDYGQTIAINRDEVPLIILQDLSRVHDGQIEVGMAQSRAQAAAQRKASNDPALKLLTPAGPGMRLG
jgi:hypothetical protein